MESSRKSRVSAYAVSRHPTRKPIHFYERKFPSMTLKSDVASAAGFRNSLLSNPGNRDRYLEKPTRRIDLSKPPLPNNDVRPAPSRQYSEEAFMWEEERETISDKPEGPQKSKNVVESNADTEPARDDIYDTLTFGSIRVTEVINVRDVPSSSSEQPPGEPSLVSMKCSQPEISAFGESEATGATSQTETNVAVQASEPQPILPESTLLQSTSRDIEEIKRMLKEMQCKLEQVEFPADETCTPTDGQCCALQRKGLSTRQLNLFAFAVSSIVCLQGIVAASITTVLWSRGSKYYPHLPHRLDELALTFLIIEILLATLAFCGCWSVRKKSPVMMTLTAAANSILILIQFGTLGWTFSRTPQASLEGFEITVSGLQTLFLSVFSLSLCLQVLNVVLLFTLACRYGNL